MYFKGKAPHLSVIIKIGNHTSNYAIFMGFEGGGGAWSHWDYSEIMIAHREYNLHFPQRNIISCL